MDERLDHVFKFYGLDSLNERLNQVSVVIIESLQNSRTGRLSLDILRPLVLACLELDDWCSQYPESKAVFEKRFFEEIVKLKGTGRIKQSHMTIELCEQPQADSESAIHINKENGHSAPHMPSLPDLPVENLTDAMPDYEDVDIEHDEETLSLLNIMRNRTERDNIEPFAQEGLDAKSKEQTAPTLVSLMEHLSKIGSNNILKITHIWGTLVVDARFDTQFDEQMISCTVKHLVESNTVVISSLLPLDEGSVWDILDASGEESFISSIGTTRDPEVCYVIKKKINLNTYCIADVAIIVMQVLSEAAELSAIINYNLRL